MRAVAEKLKELASQEGKALCEFTGDCYLCYLKLGDTWFIVTIASGKTNYAKVVPYSQFPIVENCEGVLAAPNGLFAFSENEEELAKLIIEKARRMRGIRPSRPRSP